MFFLLLVSSPTTLCLGDSIRIGWAAHVECAQPEGNCQESRQLLDAIDECTGGKHWEAVVFNAGLHDIQRGRNVTDYAANLRAIIKKLRASCDRIYFCSITPGRPDQRFCTPEAVERFNRAALAVMSEERVPVIDLYGACMAHPEWWKKDIHYTEEGYKQMAQYIKARIAQGAPPSGR